MIYLPRVIICAVLMILLGACASQENFDTSTAEGSFQRAQSLAEQSRYEEALAQYKEVKAKHPYSPYAVRAELAAADLHFERKAFAEAQAAYQLFKQYHPSFEKIDYVTYRLALSYYHQLPKVVSRDLTLAGPAIATFQEVFTSYPKSEYAKDSRQKVQEIRQMLAERQMFVGDFYLHNEKWQSALGRYENVINKYSDSRFTQEALRKAVISAENLKNEEKVRKYSKLLKESSPRASDGKARELE